jgi:hypothetical protein
MIAEGVSTGLRPVLAERATAPSARARLILLELAEAERALLG